MVVVVTFVYAVLAELVQWSNVFRSDGREDGFSELAIPDVVWVAPIKPTTANPITFGATCRIDMWCLASWSVPRCTAGHRAVFLKQAIDVDDIGTR